MSISAGVQVSAVTLPMRKSADVASQELESSLGGGDCKFAARRPGEVRDRTGQVRAVSGGT